MESKKKFWNFQTSYVSMATMHSFVRFHSGAVKFRALWHSSKDWLNIKATTRSIFLNFARCVKHLIGWWNLLFLFYLLTHLKCLRNSHFTEVIGPSPFKEARRFELSTLFSRIASDNTTHILLLASKRNLFSFPFVILC